MSVPDTPEFRFFLIALRHALGTADTAAVTRAGADVSNWTAIVQGAARHNLGPVILSAIEQCSVRAPKRALAGLHRQTRRATMRDLGQIAELDRLVPAFAAAGIRVMAFKGVTLSAQLGIAAARGAMDVDLLVDPAEFERARTLLLERDYCALHPERSRRQTKIYRTLIKDEIFVHGVNGTVVELHARLFNNAAFLLIDFETLWAAHDRVSLGETVVATFGRLHLTLYLFAHGAHQHGWTRLQWLVDLAQAFKEPGLLSEIRVAVEDARLGSAFSHTLIVLREWLNFPAAQDAAVVRRGDLRARCLDYLLSKFYAGSAWYRTPPPNSWNGFLRVSVWHRVYVLLLKPGPRYVLGQLKRDLIVPADWDLIRLPDSLSFGYLALRPFGWLIRRLRRARPRRH